MSSPPLPLESASTDRDDPDFDSRFNASGKPETKKRRDNRNRAAATLKTSSLLAETRTTAYQKRVTALTNQTRQDKSRIDRLHRDNSELTKLITKLRGDLALFARPTRRSQSPA